MARLARLFRGMNYNTLLALVALPVLVFVLIRERFTKSEGKQGFEWSRKDAEAK